MVGGGATDFIGSGVFGWGFSGFCWGMTTAGFGATTGFAAGCSSTRAPNETSRTIWAGGAEYRREGVDIKGGSRKIIIM
ncbi:MAG: hypothetical protein HZA20_13120 [Nitrospirae bacterium]|nr:hypothetical protein [Nitrospirota bacterium]